MKVVVMERDVVSAQGTATDCDHSAAQFYGVPRMEKSGNGKMALRLPFDKASRNILLPLASAVSQAAPVLVILLDNWGLRCESLTVQSPWHAGRPPAQPLCHLPAAGQVIAKIKEREAPAAFRMSQ